MLNLISEMIVKSKDIFFDYNRAFVENFVTEELVSKGFQKLYYWTSGSKVEVDFVINVNNQILPLEVNSLRSYQGNIIQI